ncbi:hemerythrin domain-containing protein [Antarctobacter sp.]|uniref:hemerythrin domain-containing protein n=1 Tax=Antarctobacter sp. TaxID=1872577 RepID=UPI002B26F36F|nr:hemerythrin domain-containing protein [Antarctobacter sp.]
MHIVLCTCCVDFASIRPILRVMDSTLDLTRRDGLPEALYALRADYPRDTWQDHKNFDGLVAFWLDRHLMFRRLSETLRQDAEALVDRNIEPRQMQARLSRFGGMLLQQLHGHHQIEDMHYFPKLVGVEARLSRGFEILDRDHHAMDGLLQRFADSANGVLQDKVEAGAYHTEVTGFEALLLRHLEDEEDLIVPILLKHGPQGIE